MRPKLGVQIIKYSFMWLYAGIAIFLFLWVFISSLKSNGEIFRAPFGLPSALNFDNYTRAWTSASIGKYFWNSLFVTCVSVVITLFLASLTAYGLSRFKFKGNFIVWVLFAMGMVIPLQSLLLPTFLKMNSLGLRNTLLALIIVYAVFALPKSVFLLAGFMRGLPKELEEAATIDGASLWTNYWKIILPLSMPGLATMFILDFIGAWNEYIYASVLISSDTNRTIPIGLANFRGEYASEYGLICAGIIITMIPVMIVYMFFQEQIVNGMASGALKG